MWPQHRPHRHLDNVDATMSILDVSMLTGFSPDLQDLKRVSMGTRGHMWGHGDKGRGHSTLLLCATMPSCHHVPIFPCAAESLALATCPLVSLCPCVPMSSCVPLWSHIPHVVPCPHVPPRLPIPSCPPVSPRPLVSPHPPVPPPLPVSPSVPTSPHVLIAPCPRIPASCHGPHVSPCARCHRVPVPSSRKGWTGTSPSSRSTKRWRSAATSSSTWTRWGQWGHEDGDKDGMGLWARWDRGGDSNKDGDKDMGDDGDMGVGTRMGTQVGLGTGKGSQGWGQGQGWLHMVDGDMAVTQLGTGPGWGLWC